MSHSTVKPWATLSQPIMSLCHCLHSPMSHSTVKPWATLSQPIMSLCHRLHSPDVCLTQLWSHGMLSASPLCHYLHSPDVCLTQFWSHKMFSASQLCHYVSIYTALMSVSLSCGAMSALSQPIMSLCHYLHSPDVRLPQL